MAELIEPKLFVTNTKFPNIFLSNRQETDKQWREASTDYVGCSMWERKGRDLSLPNFDNIF